MHTVVLEVRSLTDTLAQASRAMVTGRAEREARIGFATPELLWQVVTAKRWELLKGMRGGPMSIREAARRVGRDVKAVHGDVTALVDAGILSRTNDGVEFPFEAVKVEFLHLRRSKTTGSPTASSASSRWVCSPAFRCQ